MTALQETLEAAARHWPSLTGIAIVLAGIYALRWFLVLRTEQASAEERLPRLLWLLAATAVALVLVVLLLPIGETTRGQLLGLFGVALTVMVALASTTFVANIMAGMMLRIVKSFRPGDFLRVEQHFGRVSDRGLFHVEIQTEDGDLTTLPNLFVATHPVSVVRSAGTIISATVSLGYDLAHDRVTRLLMRAAEAAGLSDPFVQVVELGDFSVSYRVAGRLEDVKTLLSARSRLRCEMLDALHGDDVEIVSPGFMNQRQLAPSDRFVAPPTPRTAESVGDRTPEEIIFDKAVEAEKLEAIKAQIERLGEALAALEAERDIPEDAREQHERSKENIRRRISLLSRTLETAQSVAQE